MVSPFAMVSLFGDPNARHSTDRDLLRRSKSSRARSAGSRGNLAVVNATVLRSVDRNGCIRKGMFSEYMPPPFLDSDWSGGTEDADTRDRL